MLVEKRLCTACGNCMLICNKNAISFKEDQYRNIFPYIDKDKCVECGLCNKVCPALNSVAKNKVLTCYAAYSRDSDLRKKSASGGIASAIYSYAIRNHIVFNGVALDLNNFEAHHLLGESEEDIEKFCNSKYTFSFMDDIVISMHKRISNGQSVIFIGLPCQCAALKKYCIVKKLNIDKVIIIDLVCHGVPSHKYLQEHISSIFDNEQVQKVFFRDPKFGTSNFVFSIYGTKKNYSRKVESTDNYQMAYHTGTIYRENCYECKYATNDRVGDLTICDFASLGKMSEFTDARREISRGITCLMVNTEKGKQFVDILCREGYIEATERPVEEIIKFEGQLNHPTISNKFREKFLKLIKVVGFNKACDKIFVIEKKKKILIRTVKDCVKKIIRRK